MSGFVLDVREERGSGLRGEAGSKDPLNRTSGYQFLMRNKER